MRKIRIATAIAVLMLVVSATPAGAADCGLLGWLVGCDPMMAGTTQEEMEQETKRRAAELQAQVDIQQAQLNAQALQAQAQWNAQVAMHASNNDVAIAAMTRDTTSSLALVALIITMGLLGAGGFYYLAHRQPAQQPMAQPVWVLPPPSSQSHAMMPVARDAFKQICNSQGVEWRQKGTVVEVYNKEARVWVRVPESKMLTMAQEAGVV